MARTDFGYPLDVVRSWIQKAIRRGDELGAAWAAYVLLRHGWAKYLHRTLRGICAEDIGVSDLDAVVAVDAILRNGDLATEGGKKPLFCGLAEMQAVIVMCRARKDWRATHLLLRCLRLWKDVESGRTLPPTPPDCALDGHTETGRRLGRTKIAWFGEGDALQPPGEEHFHNLDDAGVSVDPHSWVHGDPELVE